MPGRRLNMPLICGSRLVINLRLPSGLHACRTPAHALPKPCSLWLAAPRLRYMMRSLYSGGELVPRFCKALLGQRVHNCCVSEEGNRPVQLEDYGRLTHVTAGVHARWLLAYHAQCMSLSINALQS